MHYLDVAARFLLGTVFLVAVVGKVSSKAAFAAFTGSLTRMAVLPPRAAGPAARVTVVLEALTVVLLAVPVELAAAAGFVVAGGLLAAFTVAIGLSLRTGNRAPCRCFGASSTPLGPRHIVRNGLLIAVAAAGLLGLAAAGESDLAGTVVAALAGLIAGAAVAALDDIVELVRA
ncbi:MauE/DoxX family redox-associated membrane protein [Actinophytocola sp.]|uniref:MauE/DoxX family redox-associated membrane protein n=1 Tax=Actinophytocola sp. TaxID=1872138 RepID=UPI002D80C39E|nr:MauE/DoxX family redox-associated membrane protein [Actinophytocola sp.]HET9140864.1 MauE/DoxX family redox-associated membrane protein [Actinophytocola sp.]